MLTPQMVECDVKTGLKHNRYKIQGKTGKLFSRLAPVSFIRPYLSGDPLFMAILDRWPSEGRIGQHTLTESRRKWGLNSITTNDSMETNNSSTKMSRSPREASANLQTLDKQGTPSRGSSHLAPTGIDKINHKAKPGDPGQVSIDRVMKLARLTGSAQYYAPQDPHKGLEWLPNSPESPEPPHNQTVPDPVSGGGHQHSPQIHMTCPTVHSLQAHRPRQLYLGSRRAPYPNLRVKD